MLIPILGMIFLLLGIIGFFLRPRYLMGLVVISSIFQGAAVFSLEYPVVYNLSPYYFCGLLLIIRHALQRRPATSEWLRLGPSVYVFAFWCSGTAIALPFIFSGIGVYNPRAGLDEQFLGLTPLAFDFGNLSQIFYLWVNVGVLRAFQCAGGLEARFANRAFRWTVIVALSLALLQYLHFTFGTPYPVDFIYSNQQVRSAMPDDFVGYSRVFSTFPEPSYFSVFLVGSCFWAYSNRGVARAYRWMIVLLLMIALILTESSTGYLTFIVMVSFFLFFKFREALVRYGLMGLCALLAALGCMWLFGQLFSRFDVVGDLLGRALLDKGDTASLLHRIAADTRAVELFVDTGGLGVGVGSNRASSFFTTLISTVGVVGVVLFVRCMLIQVRNRPEIRVGEVTRRRDFGGGQWVLLSILVGMLIGVPDLNWPIFWVFWGGGNIFVSMKCLAGLSPVRRGKL
jgi:hypothetical protein